MLWWSWRWCLQGDGEALEIMREIMMNYPSSTFSKWTLSIFTHLLTHIFTKFSFLWFIVLSAHHLALISFRMNLQTTDFAIMLYNYPEVSGSGVFHQILGTITGTAEWWGVEYRTGVGIYIYQYIILLLYLCTYITNILYSSGDISFTRAVYNLVHYPMGSYITQETPIPQKWTTIKWEK